MDGSDRPEPGVMTDAEAACVPAVPTLWRLALAAVIVIAVLAALYVARSLLLPIMLALVFSLLLRPVVRFLNRIHLPEALGAGLVVILVLSAGSATVALLYGPAIEWAQRLPEALGRFEQLLFGVLQVLMEVAVPDPTELAGPMEAGELLAPLVRGVVLDRVWQLVGGSVVTLFLVYFMLASGDLFLRKTVRVILRAENKRRAIAAARLIEHDVSRYLFTIAVINTVLGVLVAAVMWMLSMPNPVLWGVLAGTLNFIPYIGPFITLSTIAAAALLTFPTVPAALLPPAVFLVLTTLEGQLITPLILGARLLLNPVAIFLGIIFWGWLWGIVGALLAVPITMSLKILCDAVPPLNPVSEFLSRE